MIICHQCGHKIEVYSNITTIRCSSCRAVHTIRPAKPIPSPEVTPPVQTPPENGRNTVGENSAGTGFEDKTVFFSNKPTEPKPTQSEIKIGLKCLGTFDVDFLEKIKVFSMPFAYQKEIVYKQGNNQFPILGISKDKVLIGRKPMNPDGFEDVDIKLDSQDTTISRRQCELQIKKQQNTVALSLTTHANAANLVEVNGKPIERGIIRQIHQGDFLRLGNTIFEVIVEIPQNNTADTDYNKTIVF